MGALNAGMEGLEAAGCCWYGKQNTGDDSTRDDGTDKGLESRAC